MEIDIGKVRKEFLSGNNQIMVSISEEYGLYCVRYLMAKHQCEEDIARDIFTDSMIAFRDSVISGKIVEIKKLKNYLLGICIKLFQLSKRNDYRKVNKIQEIKGFLYNDNPNYLDLIIKEEHEARLKKITMISFNQLSNSCKQILKLFYVEELSLLEIASELDISSEQVAKSTKYRCFKKWNEIINKIKKMNYVD